MDIVIFKYPHFLYFHLDCVFLFYQFKQPIANFLYVISTIINKIINYGSLFAIWRFFCLYDFKFPCCAQSINKILNIDFWKFPKKHSIFAITKTSGKHWLKQQKGSHFSDLTGGLIKVCKQIQLILSIPS